MSDSNVSNAFVDVVIYSAWETDEIIAYELTRNLSLAMICVFVVREDEFTNLRQI
jgi:hypothetical protein